MPDANQKSPEVRVLEAATPRQWGGRRGFGIGPRSMSPDDKHKMGACNVENPYRKTTVKLRQIAGVFASRWLCLCLWLG